MPKGNTPTGAADWTQLLTDPDLVKHLGELLQTYREAAPEKRDQALMEAMRRIKSKPAPGAATTSAEAESQVSFKVDEPDVTSPVPANPSEVPPFQPDIFTPNWGQDRRQFPRV